MKKLLLTLALLWIASAQADILISQPNGTNAVISATPQGATPTTPQTLNVICPTCSGSGGTPGGSNTQVQYNNSGAFGGITGATTDGTTLTLVAPVLGTPASGVATNLTGTAAGLTAGNVTTNANLTGDVTSVGNATTLITTQTGVHTWSSAQTYSGTEINSTNGAASVPSKTFTGTVFTGGSGTTTFPQILVQPTGTSAATGWSTSGTIFGANVVSGFAGAFLDFHAAGASSVFNVLSTGALNSAGAISGFSLTATSGSVTAASGSLTIAPVGAITFSTRGVLTSPAAGSVQFGSADVDTAPVAQTLRSQGALAGGTSNVAGANFTVIASPGKGTGAGGSLIFQTAPAGSTGTAVNAPVTALTINSAQNILWSAGVTTDATKTDTTLCLDTSTNQMYKGSGTLGICLGTSSARFKQDIAPLEAGLAQIMAVQSVRYRTDAQHGDPDKVLYGFTAEQAGAVLPALMGRDKEDRPNTFDYLGMVPVLVKAVQELKADNDNLRAELHAQQSKGNR